MRSKETASICPGPVNRRAFLRIGGLGLGALAAGAANPTLARLLAAAAGQPKADRKFSVILLWAAGGPSQLETFDMKPDAPAEYRGEFRPIQTNVPGIEICELLPRLAKMADKFSLVRSLQHTRTSHPGGTARMLSGYVTPADPPTASDYPEIASVVAKQLEREAIDLPLVVASGPHVYSGGGPAYLGPAYVPFHYGGDPNSPKFTVGSLTVDARGIAKLQKRYALLKRFDTLRRDLDQSQTMGALDEFNRQALEMLTSSRTRDAFDLAREPAALRDRYGRTTGGQSLLLARRLVEAGVRFVHINAEFPVTKAATNLPAVNWDDHSSNTHIFKAYRERLPALDVAIAALLEDLYTRGLDRDVLFVFCGEFGRTPKVNTIPSGAKGPGRDHWAQAFTAFLAGGGLKMGQVVGATNARGEEPVERIMNSNCLLATIYRRFGIDTTRAYPDHNGRPVPILTDGEPIEELF